MACDYTPESGSALTPPDFSGKRKYRKSTRFCPRCSRRMFRRGVLLECPGCSHQLSAPAIKRRLRQPQPVDKIVDSIRSQISVETPELAKASEHYDPPVELASEGSCLGLVFAASFMLGSVWSIGLLNIYLRSFGPIVAWMMFDGLAFIVCGIIFRSAWHKGLPLVAILMLFGATGGAIQCLSMLGSEPIMHPEQPVWTVWLTGLWHVLLCSWVLYYLARLKDSLND